MNNPTKVSRNYIKALSELRDGLNSQEFGIDGQLSPKVTVNLSRKSILIAIHSIKEAMKELEKEKE